MRYIQESGKLKKFKEHVAAAYKIFGLYKLGNEFFTTPIVLHSQLKWYANQAYFEKTHFSQISVLPESLS